jgi:hypothetical protein
MNSFWFRIGTDSNGCHKLSATGILSTQVPKIDMRIIRRHGMSDREILATTLALKESNSVSLTDLQTYPGKAPL